MILDLFEAMVKGYKTQVIQTKKRFHAWLFVK